MNYENPSRNATIALASLVALLWVWPNFIHEPLHLLALHLQGVQGYITFDFMSWPATPTTQALSSRSGVIGGLLYVLLPSIVNIIIVAILWMTRRSAGLLTHIVLPTYLLFDLFVNVLGFTEPTNDFHFLTASPSWITPAIIVALCAITATYFNSLLRVSNEDAKSTLHEEPQ